MSGWTRLSLPLQRLLTFVQHVSIFLVTGCCASTEKPSSPWFDHPSVLAKPPVWDRGNGVNWRLCLCPSSAPSKYRESWELWWLHERKDPLYDGYHTCLRTRISSDMSIKTRAGNQGDKFPSTEAQRQISVPSQCSFHNTWKEAMISEGGPFIRMVVLASRMVKLSLGGVSLHDLSVEELVSCLVLSSPPRLILPPQVPELTPITPLKWLLWLKRCLSLVLMVRWPEMWKRVFFSKNSKHAAGVSLGTIQARTHFQLALACQRSMLCAQHRLRLTCNTCTVTLGIWVMNVMTMPRHLVHLASACCDGCNNISEILERLQQSRTDATSLSQNGS